MTKDSSPQSGDVYLKFNGRDAYVEVPSIADYSVSTTGELTISAWLRPDTLNFPSVERNSDYIHWLGKGESSGAGGNQEWTFRMYNHFDPLDSPSRPNRISFYLFNPQGGLGVGSYVQVPIHKGKWIHIVGVADSSRTYLYKDGQFIHAIHFGRRRRPATSTTRRHPPEFAARYRSARPAGTPPARNKDLGSFFEGGLTRLRVWNRALIAGEISALYSADARPENGLVAEFLINND